MALKNNSKLINDYFQLKPLKAAKVSEISEATAASPVAEDERVNFHIGHPVQDEQLTRLYFEMTSGISLPQNGSLGDVLKSDISEQGWTEKQKPLLKLLADAIQKSGPYMPRGGYNRKNPDELIDTLQHWLVHKQQDPIEYDSGKESGFKEIMIGSGGIYENLRVLFFALSRFLKFRPSAILCHKFDLPDYLKTTPGFPVEDLPNSEEVAFEQIEQKIHSNPAQPLFILLGKITSENTRRNLRNLGLDYPLYFIEVNDAPNHLSLAREAKMARRVLRLITPMVFSETLSGSSIVFALGNSDLINILETVHFELKGTPSGPEIVLLYDLLENGIQHYNTKQEPSVQNPPQKSSAEKFIHDLSEKVDRLGGQVSAKVEQTGERLGNALSAYQKLNDTLQDKLEHLSPWQLQSVDDFAELLPAEILEKFKSQKNPGELIGQLSHNFLGAFRKVHPEYSSSDLFLVSGSARTALSLLGFHCSIEEIITSDLSWTYEHCFPKVRTLPLNEQLSFDPAAYIQAISNHFEKNTLQKSKSAFVFNNPHNASGNVFEEEKIRELLCWLLQNDLNVIDDLSYQNVGPSAEFCEIKTLRQIANQLLRDGYISKKQSDNLITVHSLSKTDSFAGARLAVVEIRNSDFKEKFRRLYETIVPNHLAIITAYLFYRNHPENVQHFWQLRNHIFFERMQAMEKAAAELPDERNPYNIKILRPVGSMYPRLVVERLPKGLSLDWLASGLSTQGIGLVPLSTFARTGLGFELARKTFRLTLGGSGDPEKLYRQTRRVLIDLNRLIDQEAAKYKRRTLPDAKHNNRLIEKHKTAWNDFQGRLSASCQILALKRFSDFSKNFTGSGSGQSFYDVFLPERMQTFEQRFKDKMDLAGTMLANNTKEQREKIINLLDRELYKETLEQRQARFRKRLFDRTVHPTQMYALTVDLKIDTIIKDFLGGGNPTDAQINQLAQSIVDEYLAVNIPISSELEADELLFDLDLLIESEEFSRWQTGTEAATYLSFWGDWDGSTRPSGQGHRLVAAVVIKNVARMAKVISTLVRVDPSVKVDPEILKEIRHLPGRRQKFWKLLNEITLLTNQLEKRYRSFLPFVVKSGKIRQLASRLHLASDPLKALWQHNDRLERKMLELRGQRRQSLEYYFSLNKNLRKTLHGLLPQIKANLHQPEVLFTAGTYRNLLQRFVLTPRIHQKLITSKDSFSIDTTVHNLTEINEISGNYGNPGMVLALQVSMSTDAQALITLDRKLRARREQSLREKSGTVIPDIWTIPLFEDQQAVNNMESYLNNLWDYSTRSRRIQQDPAERFAEIICELFIAGSDLSQQVSQAAGAALYSDAKYRAVKWLAEKGLIEKVRMKLGSGEPMQRQGGYYEKQPGKAVFLKSKDSQTRMGRNIKASTQKSTDYARSPLRGLLSSGDLRTFQSNIAEKLRFISSAERAQLLFHIGHLQKYHEGELSRAGEPLLETRLQFKERGLKELERLTRGLPDPHYKQFVELATKNFRQILYGLEEDVIGIHIISYFLSRSTPTLRDRPTIRPTREMSKNIGQKVIERIAQTLPLSNHGSLLRAIGHNRAQTMILGVNQLTTGLFRALNEFLRQHSHRADGLGLISDRILPKLPVYEILHTLRIYHDRELTYLTRLEKLFPAGNSAFLILREDIDSFEPFIGLFQKELLRRHGLDVTDFFEGDRFITDLLPTVQPHLAVLLQNDLFNTDLQTILQSLNGQVDQSWQKKMDRHLNIPDQLAFWRDKIWKLIGPAIEQQVASFVELAIAVYSLTLGRGQQELPFSTESAKVERMGSSIKGNLGGVMDDSMRQFLLASVQYLTQLPKTMQEVPIDIIRALKDVEQIIKMEDQALSGKDQDLLRFYILQAARICGENG